MNNTKIVRSHKSVVHVRIDKWKVTNKIPIQIPIQAEFSLPVIEVDNLVNNLERKGVELLDACDKTRLAHEIHKLVLKGCRGNRNAGVDHPPRIAYLERLPK